MSIDQQRTTRRRAVAAVVGTGSALMLASHTRLLAQDATPPAEGDGPPGPPLPEGAIVVAEGLWNPYGLLFADGTLYVGESGVASPGTDGESVATPNAEGTPIAQVPGPVPGQVTVISASNETSVIGVGADGVVGMAIVDGTLYVACGGGSVGSGFQPLPIETTVDAIDLDSGELSEIASPGDYEVENNPDGTDVNPNLYGMAANADGMLFVADAGGNAIYQVDPATGEFSLFAVVPTLEELTESTPGAGAPPRQSVPTGVVVDDSGNVHVLLLGIGFWPGPSLLTFAPDGSYTAGPAGLTTAVALAMGPDGLLYATQLSDDFEGEQPGPGNVFRIGADGTLETVVEGLFFPHGLAFDDDGNLYVTTNAIISAPDAPLGQVLRFDGIATPA